MGPYKQEFPNWPHIVGVWNRRSPTFGRDLADKVKRKKEKCTIHIGKARESKRRTLPLSSSALRRRFYCSRIRRNIDFSNKVENSRRFRSDTRELEVSWEKDLKCFAFPMTP